MPAPGLFYYYPTAIPLNGYGGGVMAASPATPMVRYRTAGAYLPAAAAAPTPEMMDYSSLYNGVSLILGYDSCVNTAYLLVVAESSSSTL